ncbi:BCHE [Bugula neritina]|nr:BCHE [Bugula neritina]
MTEKKAIMVWIYGGGFYSGSSTLDIYDGRYLAASQNVIVVSMQYRLGILGFLNLESEEAPGNMALFDQLMGLQWVQDNAEYLYGDKNNVTIMGESAGSVSVSLHLISAKSRNLFNRAILQSGAATANWALMTVESSWYRLNKTIYSKDIGCSTITTHVPTLMKCLRSVPAGVLFDYSWAPSGIAQFSWLPSVDHDFLTELPETSLRKGNFKRCPILIGSNANEGSSFLVYEFYYQGFGPIFKSKEINFTISHSRFVNDINRAFRYYPQWPTSMNQFGKDAIAFRYTDWRNKDDSLLNRHNIDLSVGDYHFLCPTNAFSQYFVNVGLPVYYYYFTHRSTRNPWGKWMGVMHGDEIFFTFGLPIRPDSQYTEDEKLLSMHMMQLWSNFSKTGHPNGLDNGGLWSWTPASQFGKEFYELSIPSLTSPTFGSGPRTEHCAFWDSYLPGLVTGTADIHDVEKEWKEQFAEWNTYIVHWKHEYQNYMQTEYEQTKCDQQLNVQKRETGEL